MAQYVQGDYQPPRPDIYPRQASSASMNSRYVPDSYGGPAASQPAPQPPAGYTAPLSRPRGPSLGSQQVPSILPQPNYGPGTGMPPPNSQLHPATANYPPQAPPYPQSVDADGYMQPPSNPRRHSQASTYSQRSQRSHKSHHSHHSHHSRNSRDSHRSKHSERSREGDRRSGEDRRSKESRRSREERDFDPPKPAKTHRPSWGDTIYGMFGVIKDALGPRDKY